MGRTWRTTQQTWHQKGHPHTKRIALCGPSAGSKTDENFRPQKHQVKRTKEENTAWTTSRWRAVGVVDGRKELRGSIAMETVSSVESRAGI